MVLNDWRVSIFLTRNFLARNRAARNPLYSRFFYFYKYLFYKQSMMSTHYSERGTMLCSRSAALFLFMIKNIFS